MSDDLNDLFRKKLLEDIGIRENTQKKEEKCNFFRELCKDKIDYNDSSDAISAHEKFIDIVDNLNCKYLE